MESPAGVTEYLLSLGLPGLIILALGFIAWRLFNLYVETTNKRIEEAGAYKVALLDVTNQLKTMTVALEAIARSK